MDQLRALHDSDGDEIGTIIQPTLKILASLLMKNKHAIQDIHRDTKPYGDHPRQKLDIYSPNTKNESIYGPYLIFLYGGGLTRGDKILPVIPDGLVYHNVGAFFANRGIKTIIPDYRRVNSETGGEDARFPSGAEDLAAVLKFVATLEPNRKTDVFIMGNSAGGVHLSTFLLEPRFLEQRKALSSNTDSLRLKGAIGVGVPFHFKTAAPSRGEMLKLYYGEQEEVDKRQPYGLLEALAKAGKTREETFVPKFLAIQSEYDPEDEIMKPVKDFVELMNKTWEGGIELWTIPGHNHISPPATLMTGDKEAEKWGEDVASWIKELSSK